MNKPAGTSVRVPARVLPAIVLAQCAGTSSWFAVNAVMPYLQQAFGWPAQAGGTLTSAVQLGFIAGTLVFAVLALADRHSARGLFLLCALAGAACTLAAAWSAASMPALLGWRFATGFFLAGIYPVGMKIAAMWFPRGLGAALGWLVGAPVIGSASPHALRALGTHWPWQQVFWSVAAISALAGVLLFIAVPEPPHAAARARGLAVRLAAAYRSEIKYKVGGTADFKNPTVNLPPGTAPVLAATIETLANAVNTQALYNRSITSDITLPQIANLSAVWRVNPQWEVMADAQWTGWSSIPDLTYINPHGSVLQSIPLEWDDSWKFAVGTSYRYNDQWKARFGVAFDQTPVTTHPTARLPDSDRWWLTVGGECRWTRDWKFDAGLVYIKGDSADFNQQFSAAEAAALGQIRGSYDASVWILSAQAAYSF